MICNNCGLPFDESDLSQVFYHEHNGLIFELKDVKSKKLIKHASELYPNCSKQFACGVHTWINNGDKYEYLMFLEDEDFKLGYWQAKYDLEDNYKMNR